MNIIEEKLEQLPLLPNIIFDLQKLKDTADFDTKKVLEILEEDHFVNTKILQMANSKLFGFSNHVDTLSKALALYGINFTISIAMAQIIQDTIRLNLGLYDLKIKKFIFFAECSLKLMWLWIEENDFLLKEQLIIPCLIHEIGKSFISSYILDEKVGSFINELKLLPHNISLIEKKYTSYTSYEVTTLMLKKWNFDSKTIEIINNINFPNDKATYIMDVIKTIFNISSPFTKDSITLGIRKADMYGLDVTRLKQSLQELMILIKKDL